MGAIVSDFVNLPDDAALDRAAKYQLVYDELTALGHSVPATPADTITRADLLAHLQTIVGSIAQGELTGDPEVLGYGANDAADAALISTRYLPQSPKVLEGSEGFGYRTQAGSTADSLIAVKALGGTDPDFITLLTKGGENTRAIVRFSPATATVALQGVIAKIMVAAASDTLTLSVPLGLVVPANEVFTLITGAPLRKAARYFTLLERFPYAPNSMTAADIAAARS